MKKLLTKIVTGLSKFLILQISNSPKNSHGAKSGYKKRFKLGLLKKKT